MFGKQFSVEAESRSRSAAPGLDLGLDGVAGRAVSLDVIPHRTARTLPPNPAKPLLRTTCCVYAGSIGPAEPRSRQTSEETGRYTSAGRAKQAMQPGPCGPSSPAIRKQDEATADPAHRARRRLRNSLLLAPKPSGDQRSRRSADRAATQGRADSALVGARLRSSQ